MNKDITVLEKNLAIVTASILAVFFFYLFYWVGQGKEVVSGLETELPIATNVLLSTYYFFVIFSLGSLYGAYKVIQQRNRSGWYVIFVMGLVGLILLPVIVWALYLPVMDL